MRRPWQTSRVPLWSAMRLQQGQLWKKQDHHLRIVELERLRVRYKCIFDLASGEGEFHDVSKKAFCRLLKGATLVG